MKPLVAPPRACFLWAIFWRRVICEWCYWLMWLKQSIKRELNIIKIQVMVLRFLLILSTKEGWYCTSSMEGCFWIEEIKLATVFSSANSAFKRISMLGYRGLCPKNEMKSSPKSIFSASAASSFEINWTLFMYWVVLRRLENIIDLGTTCIGLDNQRNADVFFYIITDLIGL